MKWEPFVTVRAVRPVVMGLEALGHNTARILAASGLPRATLEDADGRILHATMMRFWEVAVAVTGDEHLGLHLAEATPLEAFGVHTYAMLSSPTLREAYHRACRYQRLIHAVTDLVFEEGDDEGVLRHALPGGQSVPRQPAELLVMLWVRFGRLILGRDWAPRLVCFAHAQPADVTEHQRIFRTAIHFASGRTAMHVPNDLLNVQNTQADQGLVGVLDDYAQRLLEQAPRRDTLSERVRLQLIGELKGGAPTAEGVARSLQVSVRTLHRALQMEGTTFSELLDQLRQEQAAVYLSAPHISISEVAFLLGFSELSAFYRAFKRWTGTTPAEYRASRLPLSPVSD